MANIYRRGRVWWARVQRGGKSYRQSLNTTKRKEAERRLNIWLDKVDDKAYAERHRHTYDEAMERFGVEFLPNLKSSSAERYRVSARQLDKHFGTLYLHEITRRCIMEYVAARKRGKVTTATIRRDLACLSSMFTCALEWEWIEHNPVRSFNMKLVPEAKPRTVYPTSADVDALCKASPPMVARIIAFAAQTGMRQEEICSLEWHQVDLDRREIRLTKTKTSSPRNVPLSDSALDTIMGTPRHIRSQVVFWHGDGQRYLGMARRYIAIAKRANVGCRFHDLRHYFASDWLKHEPDLKTLGQILGHKSINQTARYAHVTTQHLHDAMKRVDTKRAQRPTD